MTTTITCAICSPPVFLGRFEDFWEGAAVRDVHLDEHDALIPLSAISTSPDSSTTTTGA